LSYKKNSKVYILKSAPGTGKSTLLKDIYRELREWTEIEKIYCSGDINSLDGLIFKEKRVVLVDGTTPHIVEAKFPGALECEIHFGEMLNKEELYKRRDEIIKLFCKKSASFDRASRFLGAASSLLSDTYRTASENINTGKAEALAERIAKKEIPALTGERGSEIPRFLSTLTDEGVVVLKDTLSKLCDKVYVLEDEYGAASRAFMRRLKDVLRNTAYDFYTCYCPFSPFDKIDHIIIPKLRLGFATASKRINLEVSPYRTIHSTRFNVSEMSEEKKKRLKFNKNACDILLRETSSIIGETNAIHKELERIYGENMDFSSLDEIKYKIIKEIKEL
jgi:hypothetical protein